MKKSRLLGAVCACLFVGITLSGSAVATTIDAFDRGWYDDTGGHFATVKIAFAGQNNGTTVRYNSFFSFDLAAISGTVTSGTLRLELESYFGPDSSEAFTIFDVTTDVTLLNQSCTGCLTEFNDLQSGNAYGTGVVSSSDVGSVIDIILSAAAIADINAASGGLFALGVHVDQITLASGNEGLRWSGGDENRTHQLVLATSTVPIPAAVWLFGSGLLGLIGIAKRKRA